MDTKGRIKSLNTMNILGILPLVMIIIYVAVLVFSIWFAVTLIKSQKERNVILKEISNKLEVVEISKKGE